MEYVNKTIIKKSYHLWIYVHNIYKNIDILSITLIFSSKYSSTPMIKGSSWSYGSWFTNTFAIGVYHHWCCEFESRSGRSVQHFVIKFISDRTVVFSGYSGFFTNNTDHHDMTEILLKVALNTIKQTNKQTYDWRDKTRQSKWNWA